MTTSTYATTSNATYIYTTTSGAMSQEIANMLKEEYGIETIQDFKEMYKKSVSNGLKLSDKIAQKERAKTAKLLAEDWDRNSAQEEYFLASTAQELRFIGGYLASFKNVHELRAEQVRRHATFAGAELERCDFNTRHEYAWAVARTLPWTGTYEENLLYKKVFVQLRMNRLWAWTEVREVEALVEVVLNHVKKEDLYLGSDGAWDWQIGSIINLCRAGMSLQQINRFMGLVNGLRDANICISTAGHQYSGGFHFGDWVREAVNGIRRNHFNLFNTFMRVFKHTHKISPKITGRYLKMFEGMDDATLKFTATDGRNWGINSYGSYYFRMNVIVKEAAEWQPIRKNHMKDYMWLNKFGRVPQDRVLWGLPVPVVGAFTKKSFGAFMRDYKGHEWSEHGVLALAKLYIWFGKGYKALLTDNNDIHDLGINLPDRPFEEGRKFLMRYKHSWNLATRVVKNWEAVQNGGINPLAKDGLKTALNFISTLSFDNVKDIEFAIECGKYITNQSAFEKIQRVWLNRNTAYESIPKVVISDGDWKFYRLDRDDVRGPWLGNYTGCCQHPGGAGESCAIHGTTSPDGAFVVLEHRGTIKFQSWVWRSGECLVFDNVEGAIKSDLYEEAKRIYLKGILSFRGRLGIKRVMVGTGLGDMCFSNEGKHLKLPIPKPPGYSDANNVWEIKEE